MNTLLKIKMPCNGLAEFKETGNAINPKLIKDIPSYLIKRIEISDLDWSDKPAQATVYCYQPVDESIFSSEEYGKKHQLEMTEIKE